MRFSRLKKEAARICGYALIATVIAIGLSVSLPLRVCAQATGFTTDVSCTGAPATKLLGTRGGRSDLIIQNKAATGNLFIAFAKSGTTPANLSGFKVVPGGNAEWHTFGATSSTPPASHMLSGEVWYSCDAALTFTYMESATGF